MSDLNLGSLLLDIGIDLGDLKDGVGTIGAELDGLDEVVGKIGKGAALAFAGMSAAITVAVGEFIQGEDALTRAGAAAHAAGAAFDSKRLDDFAGSMQKLTGFADDQVVASNALLYSFKLTQGQAESLTPHIADLAALLGTDLVNASQMVGRAIQSGSITMLSRAGVVLDDYQKKAFEAATPTERLAMMMDILSSKAGGTAAAMAGTLGGSFKALHLTVADLAEGVGSFFEGPLKSLVQGLTAVLRPLADGLKGFKEAHPVLATIAGTVALTAVGLTGLVGALAGAALALPAVVGGLTTLLTALVGGAEAAALLTAGMGPLEGLGAMLSVAGRSAATALLPLLGYLVAIAAAVALVITTVGALHKAWDMDFMSMRTTTKGFVESITGWWETTMKFIAETFGSVIDSIAKGLVFVGALAQGKGFAKAKELAGSVQGGQGATVLKGAADMFAEDLAPATKKATLALGFLRDSFLQGVDDIKSVIGSIIGLGDAADAASTSFSGGGRGNGSLSIATSFMTGVELAVADYQTALERQARELAQQVAEETVTVGEQLRSVVSGAVNKLGEAGSVVNAGIQGMQAGPWGAVAAVIVELLSRTQAFGRIVGRMNNSLSFLVQLLEPIMEVFEPLFKAIDAVTRVTTLIMMRMGFLGTIFEVLGDVMYQVSKGANALVEGFRQGFNHIIAAIADFVGYFSEDLADEIRKAHINKADLQTAPEPTTPTMPDMTVPPEVCDCGASDSLQELADAADDVTESLTNVPQGFKVAAAQFAAAVGDVPGSQSGNTLAPGQGRGDRQVAIFEHIEIKDSDPAATWTKLKKLIDWDNFASNGTSVPASQPYAVPKV